MAPEMAWALFKRIQEVVERLESSRTCSRAPLDAAMDVETTARSEGSSTLPRITPVHCRVLEDLTVDWQASVQARAHLAWDAKT